MKHAIAFLFWMAPAVASADDSFPLAIHHRLAVELEMFTDADWIHRAGPDLSQFRLDRGEVGATVGLGPRAGAELRLESIRSAAEGGALGIAGDSIVVRIKRAQIAGDLAAGDVHLFGAAGVTQDPWIAALEDGYPLRPLSPTGSERLLGWPTSDLAALARASIGPVRLSVSFGNGEGLAYPERNNGKTTTAVAEVVPLSMPSAKLRLALMGRDGSVGPALVRDRRVGGAATLAADAVNAGIEVVHAWGIADRGDLVATVVGGWGDVRPIDHLELAARGATIGYASGGRHTSFGGAVAVEPWRDHGASLRLWLAIDRTTATGNAAPLPGADPGDATTLFLIVSTSAPFTVD